MAKRRLEDPQQKRVYDWEHQFRTIQTGAPLTPGRLHRLVRQIAKHYRVPKPQLAVCKFADKTTLAQVDHVLIEFSRKHKAWTPLIVAHEMAHYIQTKYDMYPRHSSHGKQFAGIYAYILHKFGIIPCSGSLPSMRHWKVKYFAPHNCRPAGIRNWYKP